MRAKTWTGTMVIAAAVALVVAAVVTSAGAREEVREIRLVARGMSFYLEHDLATANPTLILRAGERVHLVLRNETPGIDHDLAAASLGLDLAPVSVGQVTATVFDVPDQHGRHEYVCRPHAAMMKGIVEVR